MCGFPSGILPRWGLKKVAVPRNACYSDSVPIYEYECTKCKRRVDVMQKMTDPPPSACETCGGPLERVISPAGFQLKGGGWYKDGYAKGKPGSGSGGGDDSGSSGSASSSSGASGSESKAPAKETSSPTPKKE
jgi:putative FmdB family regulatory protein